MSNELAGFSFMLFGGLLTLVASLTAGFFLLKLVIIPFLGFIPASMVNLAILVGLVFTTGPLFWMFSVIGLAIITLVVGLFSGR